MSRFTLRQAGNYWQEHVHAQMCALELRGMEEHQHPSPPASMYGLLVEMELAKKVTVIGHHTLAIENLGHNTWLIVSASRQHLTRIDDNVCVASINSVMTPLVEDVSLHHCAKSEGSSE